MLLGPDELKSLLTGALERAAPCDAEGVLSVDSSSVTRFASNRIHQNVATEDAEASFRAASGKRVGGARTNGRRLERLGACAARAAEIARIQVEDASFPGLVKSEPSPRSDAHDAATAALVSEDKAKAVADVVAIAEEAGLEASGALSVAERELAVANSLGTFQHHPSTEVQLHVVARTGSIEGAWTETAGAWSAIDPKRAARAAVEKCRMSLDPVEVEPGEWPVILESEAVADMMDLLAYMGLGGQAFVEGTSFLCGKIGERILSEAITIADDPFNERGRIRPFDYEGVAKSKTILIEAGVARTPVYDTRTAARAGTISTGHALPEPNTFGPYPLNLVMSGGDASLEEMILSTDRGLLVSRFHYTNPVDPKRTVITGMTRFGTFLVEGGKVTRAVRSMRFTDSVVGAFSRVESVGRDVRRVNDMLAPALKLASWRFTGVTGA